MPQEIHIQVKLPPASPFDSARGSGPVLPPPSLPRVPSRLLCRPDASVFPLQWKLDNDEIATNTTLNALIAVKECVPFPTLFSPFLSPF